MTCLAATSSSASPPNSKDESRSEDRRAPAQAGALSRFQEPFGAAGFPPSMSEQQTSIRGAYYRAEAERVAQLAEGAEPGQGRELFVQVAAEYRTLAAYYETLPAPECEMEPGEFPAH
jgi:hypothetical protein